VLTKEAGGDSQIFRALPPFSTTSTTTFELQGTIDLQGSELLTGGDIAPSGDAVLLRTYGRVYLLQRVLNTPLVDTLTGPRCIGPVPNEPQGEAVAFFADATGYLTVSEGASPPLHTYSLP
jgi:hypothetical protein